MRSICRSSTSTSRPPSLNVHFVGLANYEEVLFSSAGISAVLNTLILSFGSTILSVAIGLVTAYLIALYAGRMAGFIVVFVLIPLSVSPVAVALVFSLMLDPLMGVSRRFPHGLRRADLADLQRDRRARRHHPAASLAMVADRGDPAARRHPELAERADRGGADRRRDVVSRPSAASTCRCCGRCWR